MLGMEPKASGMLSTLCQLCFIATPVTEENENIYEVTRTGIASIST